MAEYQRYRHFINALTVQVKMKNKTSEPRQRLVRYGHVYERKRHAVSETETSA